MRPENHGQGTSCSALVALPACPAQLLLCIYLFHNFKARRKYEEVLYCNVLCTVKKKLFIGVIIIRIRRSCREKKESFFQIIDYTVRV